MAIKVRLKHSSVNSKAPVAADLLDGEIGLNINENSPAAYIKNSAGQIVKLAGAGSVTDEASVKKVGDNMTGDLTLGTDKITLNANDGSAEFKGRVEIDGASGGGLYVSNGSDTQNGVLIQADDSIFYGDTNINTQGIYTSAASGISSTTGIYVGGIKDITDYDIKISLEPSGSASFAGNISAANSDTQRTTVFSSGGVYIDTDNNTGADVIQVTNSTQSPQQVVAISATGSAKFKGSIQQGLETSASPGNLLYASGGYYARFLDGSGTALQVKNGSADSVLIKADGSATFAGGTAVITPVNASFRAISSAIGVTSVCGPVSPDDSGGTTYALGVVSNDLKETKFKVLSDGSASFTGSIDSDDYIRSNRYTFNGTPIYAALNVNLNAVERAFGVWFDEFSPIAAINTDGSAVFASGGLSINENGLTSSNQYFESFRPDGANTLFSGGIGTWDSQTATNFSVKADGSATFAGNVQSGGNPIGGASTGVKLDANGYVNACRTDDTEAVFLGWKVGSGGETSRINAGGSASFSGTVQVGGNPLAGGSNSVGAAILPNGVCVLINNQVDGGGVNNPTLLIKEEGTGATKARLNNDGSATFTGTVTATVVPPSDARFKENIEPAKPQLADVIALGGLLKNYDWNDQAPLNEEIRSQRQLGLIAQEAETVCPAIVKDIHRTKQGDVITPEEIIPAVYEDKVIPAEYETVVTPAKLGPKGRVIVPESTEEVLVTPESTEQVLVTPEKVIPATYEELDDSYKGISTDALIMKLIGAVAELSAEVTALKAAKLTKK